MGETYRELTANVLHFVRLLRSLGIPVGTGRTAEFLSALDLVGVADRQDLYHAARVLLLRDIGNLAMFDMAFDLFWRVHQTRRGPRLRVPSRRGSSSSQDDGTPARRGERRPRVPLAGERAREGMIQGVAIKYSPIEVLRKVDFAALTPEQLTQIDAAIRAVPGQTQFKASRRFARGAGRRIDLRNVLRDGVRHAGEWLQPSYLARSQKRRKLLLFLDVSGSMRGFSERYLHLCYALRRRPAQEVEVFALGTRLTRLTQALRGRIPEQAIRRASQQVSDWGGGTRLGESLRAFHREWSAHTMGSGPITLLMSDGWDRGDIKTLNAEMARLRRISHRLWWLHPLMDTPGFAPRTRALVSCLRHTDALLPAGNLARLEQIVTLLDEGTDRGPVLQWRRMPSSGLTVSP